ncbi:DUF5304 family protein [Kitasatospora sp. NPDC002965]|uniref:DUF5304 family protein n=1 Tax=Kitasatospora sp. NPDC002965 TaxID=3154775 RepID=UPI0033BDBC3A
MTTTDRTEPTTEQDGPGGDGPQAHPFGPELGPLVDEVRRFAAAVGGKAQEASAETLISLAGMADRLREKQPEVYGHLAAAGTGLAAAGTELLAAYRAAVAGHEHRWTAGEPARSERVDLDAPGSAEAPGTSDTPGTSDAPDAPGQPDVPGRPGAPE